jgi:hypothetical protein
MTTTLTLTETAITASDVPTWRTPSLTYAERLLVPMAAACRTAMAAPNRDTVDTQRAYRAARATWLTFRQANGYAGSAPLLTPPSAQPKLGKSTVPTYGLMLAPATALATAHAVCPIHGVPGTVDLARVNACPAATLGCSAACLNTAGKGRLSSVQRARAIRAAFAMAYPDAFGVLLAGEIVRAARRHADVRLRLNVVSDYRWELLTLGGASMFDAMPWNVTAYDYTAWAPRHRGALPERYSLTYSVKESWTVDRMREYVAAGRNIAAVVDTRRGQALPEYWHGMPVVDGDVSDDRTTDPRGCVVLLRAKGAAIGDTSGFVWPIADGLGVPSVHALAIAASKRRHAARLDAAVAAESILQARVARALAGE